MEREVQRFICAFNSKTHIRGLFRQRNPFQIVAADFTIRLEEGCAKLVLAPEAVERDSINEVELKGDSEALKALFKGEVTLRKLLHEGTVTVNGSFRMILLLESLFLLAKEDLQEYDENKLLTPQ